MHGCPVARLGEKDTGGMNVYVLQQAKELGRRGLQTDVYTRWHDPNDPEIVELGVNARVIHVEACPPGQPKEDLSICVPEFVKNVEVFRQSRGLEYDLIHSHYWLSGSAGLVLAQLWDVPHVATFHTLAKTKLRARSGEQEPEDRAVTERRVMDETDVVVACTEQEKTDLSRLYHIDQDKVSVIPAGVDLELFKPMDRVEAKKELGWNGTYTVLYVGRIEPLKGIGLIVEALAQMEIGRNARLMVVGGKPGLDPHLDELKALSKRLGVDERVTFTGSVDQKELPKYYNAADVFVLPSYYESFGLSALEAMACGTPVVASRVGGLPSFIKSGESGYLVPWQCPEPFGERLDMLLSNAGLREAMGKTGRDIATGMGWSHVASKLHALYFGLYGEVLEPASGA